MSSSGKWDPDVMRYYHDACKAVSDGPLPELIDETEAQSPSSKSHKPKKPSPNKKRSANGSTKPLKKRRDASMSRSEDASQSPVEPENKADHVAVDGEETNSEAEKEKETKPAIVDEPAQEEAPTRQKKNAPWRKKKLEAYENEKAAEEKLKAEASAASEQASAAASSTKKLRERSNMLPLFLLEQYDDDDAEFGDIDRLRDKIFEEEQDAAIEVGLLPAHMNADEKRELPQFARKPLRYIEIRNHIIKRWLEQKDHYLKKEEVINNIKAKYQAEVSAIHDYLVRAGYINIGFLPDRPKPEAERKETVLVLGAGFAGLMAAFQLKTFGYRVTVVEARDRVGGRVRTSFLDSSPQLEKASSDASAVPPPPSGIGVDMGAMVVTGTKGNPVALICQQLKHKLHVLGSGCPLFDWRTGERVPTDIDTKVEKQFNTILDIAAKMPPRVQTSLGKAVEQLIAEANPGPLERSLFDWHVANLEYGCATELGPVSLQHWDQDDAYELGGDHCLLPSGYTSVANTIASQLDLKLSTPIKSISYSATGVQLTTNDGQTLEADYCICTLPLGVLKANTVQFNPPLPPFKRAVIQRLGYGVLNKIALHFSEVFWPAEEDYFGITAERSDIRGENFLFWNIHRCTGAPLLLALVAGKSALPIESEQDDIIAERAVAALRRVFKEKVSALVKCEVTRWRSDPYSCGSYTYIAEGASGVDYDELAQPLERLLFAGEATCREHPATVVGAALSGLREAARVERLVRGPLQAPVTEAEAATETPARDDEYYEPGSKKRRSTSGMEELPSFRKGSTNSAKTSQPSFMPAASPAPPPRAAQSKSLFSFSAPSEQSSLPKLPDVPLFSPPPMLRPLAPVQRAPYVYTPNNRPPPYQQPAPRPMPNPPVSRQPAPFPSSSQPPMGYPPPQPGYGYAAPPLLQQPLPLPVPLPPPPRPAPASAPVSQPESAAPPPRPPSASSQGKHAPASPNSVRKLREDVSEVVVKRLQHFNKAGRIADKEDFKRLARKLTHTVVEKESNRRQHVDDALRRKITQFVDRFFEKHPGVYAKSSKPSSSSSSASSAKRSSSSTSAAATTTASAAAAAGGAPDSPDDADMYIVT